MNNVVLDFDRFRKSHTNLSLRFWPIFSATTQSALSMHPMQMHLICKGVVHTWFKKINGVSFSKICTV